MPDASTRIALVVDMGAIVPSDANGRRPIHSADGQNVRVTITAADRERIRRRYPPKRLSAAAVAVLGLVILALIGYVIWVASHKANPPVSDGSTPSWSPTPN